MSTVMDQHALAAGRAFPWHEVYAPDAQAAVEFYTKVFDMETSSMPMGESGTYHMLKVNGTAVAGVMSTGTPEMQGVPPHWAVYLAVDNVDARLEKVAAAGGKLMVGPFDVPTVGRMALIQDPQGAHLWLYTPSEAM